jgi:predicted Zn finger-like uncharacterized protein
MYTQCPRCETIFRISAEILRAAAGQVRCGRCGAAFSALAHLEERPDDFPLAESWLDQDRRADQILESVMGADEQRSPVDEASIDDDPSFSAEDFAESDSGDAGAGERIERLRIVGPPVFADDESLEFTVPPGDLDRVFIAPERGAQPPPHEPMLESSSPADDDGDPEAAAPEDVEFEEIVIEATLEPPAAPDRDAPIDTPPAADVTLEPDALVDTDVSAPPEATLEPEATFEPVPESAPEPESEAEPEFEPDATVDAEPTRGSVAAADAALLAAAVRGTTPALPLARPRRRAAAALWSTLAVLLLLLLAAQIVNRERAFIASHTPFGEPLRTLYAHLGLRLPIPADLREYQLRQWGVTGDPAANGILRVRASILNTAAAFQPYPWLRVTLTDRFGHRVGTRDFAPREYLGKPPKLMAPGQRADATLNIVDPGKSAEGFEIDLCLRGDSGEMLCDSGGP